MMKSLVQICWKREECLWARHFIILTAKSLRKDLKPLVPWLLANYKQLFKICIGTFIFLIWLKSGLIKKEGKHYWQQNRPTLGL